MSACPANVWNHANGCACTARPGSATTEAADVDLSPAAPEPEVWTEAFPEGSPAALVASFKGKPVGTWFNDQSHSDSHTDTGPASFIAPDGSYVWVHEDDEPTGHWFIDGEWSDGSYIDWLSDSRDDAKHQAQATLEAGKAAWDAEQAQWR